MANKLQKQAKNYVIKSDNLIQKKSCNIISKWYIRTWVRMYLQAPGAQKDNWCRQSCLPLPAKLSLGNATAH